MFELVRLRLSPAYHASPSNFVRCPCPYLRVASRGGEGGEFSAPLGSAQSGRVVFANGASRLAIRAGSGMDDLCLARFEGPVPKVDVADGIVTFRYPRRFGGLFEWRNRSGES
jgi:hypothetical protein